MTHSAVDWMRPIGQERAASSQIYQREEYATVTCHLLPHLGDFTCMFEL
jgi:hypothetical protein